MRKCRFPFWAGKYPIFIISFRREIFHFFILFPIFIFHFFIFSFPRTPPGRTPAPMNQKSPRFLHRLRQRKIFLCLNRVGNLANAPMRRISGPPDRFVTWVRVWAASAKVAGSTPTGGILSHMCVCSCNTFTHSLSHNSPSAGLEPWAECPTVRTPTRIAKLSSRAPGLPRTIPGHNLG